MELLADEHVRRSLTNALKQQGLTVRRVARLERTGAPDQAVFDYATAHGYVVLTNDTDFERLVADHDHPGVIVITTQYATVQEVAREIIRLTDQLTADELRSGTFYVP